MSVVATFTASLLTALLVLAVAATLYLWLLAVGSLRPDRLPPETGERLRFAVLIPAHNEASTVAGTVALLRQQDYPRGRYEVYVVADHCGDATAAVARGAGAVVFERSELPAGSKGAALSWLWRQVRVAAPADAAVIFDADTRVDPGFLRAINRRLGGPELAVQGQHRIANGHDGRYPALADAMMRVDNRFGNLGRSRLGLSAKHMGDSIAFRATLLDRYTDQGGLTEDYAVRQRLLIDGIRIAYAPEAIGYGEAPTSWRAARAQRARWLSGTYRSSRRNLLALARAAWRNRSLTTLDGLVQAVVPAFSTLAVLAVAGLLGELWLVEPPRTAQLVAWLAVLLALFAYPLAGLALDRAPGRLYLALMWGPWFAVWRFALAAMVRFARREVVWVRTPRRAEGMDLSGASDRAPPTRGSSASQTGDDLP